MQTLLNRIEAIPMMDTYGRVRSIQGLLVEIVGPILAMSLGSRLRIVGRRQDLLCEIVGFQKKSALAMPFGSLDGIQMGAKACIENEESHISPSNEWLGRIVNALGEPIDGKGSLPSGEKAYFLRSKPPSAHMRRRVGGPIDLGVKSLNTFLTCCRGQRMGIFAGSGVGKSVLLSMLAKNTECQVSVIGLIGERGREVQELIEDNLGAEGLSRSILVVATSDEAALMRRQAAYLTMTLAEYFRDQQNQVLRMIDSITRFAMAQREIVLAGGEPPTTRGYTPTVFSELPSLLEHAGPGTGDGSITGLFTVLVEGDDHNEPVADAVRWILDGHIVMERAIAERGRYPAINILSSVSRAMPGCVGPEYLPLVHRARQLMSTYSDMEELIRLGACRQGSNPEVDEAIFYHPQLEAFLSQSGNENITIQQGYGQMAQILNDSETNDEISHSNDMNADFSREIGTGFEQVEGIRQ